VTDWQKIIIITYALLAGLISIVGLYQTTRKKNAFGDTPILILWGANNYGNAFIFGAFMTVTSLYTLLRNDWLLFLLMLSVFWTVRSVGETIWNFLIQFTPMKRYPPEHFFFHKIFHDESTYFVNQIVWQCVTTITIITTLYLGKLWLSSL